MSFSPAAGSTAGYDSRTHSPMYGYPQQQGYATPPRPGQYNGSFATTPGSIPPPYSQPGHDALPGYYGYNGHAPQPPFRGHSLSPSTTFGQGTAGSNRVPGWMNASPYPTPAMRNVPHASSSLTGGYTAMPARSPLNPNVSSFSPQSFTYPGTAGRDKEVNPFFRGNLRAESPEAPFAPSPAVAGLKKNSQHRSSPSISALRKQLGDDGLTSASLLTPGRTPIPSRGVSPAMSNNSALADAAVPLRDAYGLPINRVRNHKVKFPIEANDVQPDDQRKRSMWARQPAETSFVEDCLDFTIPERDAKSREAHPDELISGQDLPDTIDIYLPNDWRGLRDSLLEEKLNAIGVTREYLQHIDTLLGGKSAVPTPTKNGLNSSGPFSPLAHLQRPHFRSGSMSIGPTRLMTDIPPLSPLGSPAMVRTADPYGPKRGHAASMSMAALPHTASGALGSGFAGDTTLFTFGKRVPKAPAGPRDPFALFPMPGPGYAPSSPSIVEEDEEETDDVGSKIAETPKPARLLSLKELSAGFGISDTESETLNQSPALAGLTQGKAALAADAKPFVPIQPPLIAIAVDEGAAGGSLPPARIAISGATGHASTPSTALIVDDATVSPVDLSHTDPQIENLLRPGHEPRRSISAPDLHLLLSKVQESQDSETDPKSPFVLSEGGYAAESRADSDSESAASTNSKRKFDEYSNPSDEERAKTRRDLSRSSTSPLTSRHRPRVTQSSIASFEGLAASHPTQLSFANASSSSVLRTSVAEKWLDRHESEEIISNPSDEEEILANLGLTESRRPSWTPSFAGQFDSTFGNMPRLGPTAHAANANGSFSSATSAADRSKTSLNAAAPAFVFGSHPSRAGTASPAPNLNPAASEFKPAFTFRASGPALPPVGNDEDEDPREASSRDIKRSRRAEPESTIWLSDVSPEPTAKIVQPVSPTLNTPGFTSMQSFKFPPAPSPLKPEPTLCKPSPLSIGTPQLPPLGTIGRNTPLRAALEALNFAGSPRKGSLPDGFGGVPFRSPTRAKAPLPDFTIVDPASTSESQGPLRTLARSPSTILRPEAGAAPVLVSEFGDSQRVTPPETCVSPALQSSKEDKAPDASEIGYAGSESDAHGADSDGADSSDSKFAYSASSSHASSNVGRQVPDEELTQSWKLFEAILDRKIDALRLDVFSNSTPLPPPLLSAEASDALAASIVDAIKDEMPLRGSISVGSGAAATVGESISKDLLLAIHETQDMLSDLSKRSTSSVDALIDMLKNQPSSFGGEDGSVRSLPETFLVQIEDRVRRALPPPRENTESQQLRDLLPKLQELLNDRSETDASVLAEVREQLQALRDMQASSTGPGLLQPVLDEFAALKASLLQQGSQTVGSDNNALFELVSGLQESLDNEHARLEKSLQSMASDSNAVLGLMKEKHTLELALAESKADASRRKSVQDTEAEQVERERGRYEQELASLRQNLQGKDKQIERLREELLARAERMDAERQERASTFAVKETEWHTLRGGMEAELAIYKAQAQEHAEQRAKLEDKLEQTRERMNDIAEEQLKKIAELSHHAENAKSKVADLQRRLKEQTAKTAEVEALLQDAQMAVHASGGSLQELRRANTSLQEEVATVRAEKEAVKVSQTEMQAALEAAQDEAASQIADAAESATVVAELRQQLDAQRTQADRAQQTSLALLLHRDKLGEMLNLQPTSMYFDVWTSADSSASVGMARDASSDESAPEMMSDADDASSGTSSEETVSVTVDASTQIKTGLSLKDSMHAPKVPERSLTADDSGWFS